MAHERVEWLSMARIGAGRLQQICGVLEIPVAFAFDGSPGSNRFETRMPQYVVDFMGSADGARLVEAFGKIADRDVRREIVRMVKNVADRMQPAIDETAG